VLQDGARRQKIQLNKNNTNNLGKEFAKQEAAQKHTNNTAANESFDSAHPINNNKNNKKFQGKPFKKKDPVT